MSTYPALSVGLRMAEMPFVVGAGFAINSVKTSASIVSEKENLWGGLDRKDGFVARSGGWEILLFQ